MQIMENREEKITTHVCYAMTFSDSNWNRLSPFQHTFYKSSPQVTTLESVPFSSEFRYNLRQKCSLVLVKILTFSKLIRGCTYCFLVSLTTQ